MDLPTFMSKGRNDLLAGSIENLLNSQNRQAFYFLISQQLRGGKGKRYRNSDKRLPQGEYQELEVNGSLDSRRIIVDMSTFELYATRDHYKTITYAGRPLKF